MNLKKYKYHVYTLSCPFTGHVVYVGCTLNPIKRLNAHSSKSKRTLVSRWINAIKCLGVKPVMTVVKIFYSTGFDTTWEHRFIHKFKKLGQANFNIVVLGGIRQHPNINRSSQYEIIDIKSIEAIKITLSPFKQTA